MIRNGLFLLVGLLVALLVAMPDRARHDKRAAAKMQGAAEMQRLVHPARLSVGVIKRILAEPNVTLETPISIKLGGRLVTSPSTHASAVDAAIEFGEDEAREISLYALARSDDLATHVVALRNLVWTTNNARSDTRLIAVAERIFSRILDAPSVDAAMLEAFDFQVYFNSSALTPYLQQALLPQQPKALRRAALLAAEEMILRGNSELLEQLLVAPLPESERATLAARANPLVESERVAFEQFLAKTELTDYTLSLFPLVSSPIGPRLVTDGSYLSRSEMMQRDIAAREILSARDESGHPAFRAAILRLDSFIARHNESAL